MKIDMITGKLHRARVSDANLGYVGSITIDEKLIKAAGFLVGQKVDIVNVNNGERFSTYVIKGEFGKGDICLNGAAARKAQKGDIIIIIAYGSFEYDKAISFKPSVVILDENNDIKEIKNYV